MTAAEEAQFAERVTAELGPTMGLMLIRLYNIGYMAGHHDTVEGIFTDIAPTDMNTHHDDIVAEHLKALLDELSL